MIPTTHSFLMAHQNAVLDELNMTWFWFCVDQSSVLRAVISWMLFLAFGVLVPSLSHFVLSCTDCSSRPYDAMAQLSLSIVAAFSFICLSILLQKHGLQKLLFLNMLRDETVDVRDGYTQQFNRLPATVFVFVLPCFVIEVAYKMWQYSHGGISVWGNTIANNSVVLVICMVELCSWVYRTAVFFLVYLLFRLICALQLLRMGSFLKKFSDNSDAQSILDEHFRIRKHLKVVSQRFRFFLVSSLLLIIVSQYASLRRISRHSANIVIHDLGELAVSFYTLVLGLVIVLRSVAKVSHKARDVVGFAAEWHVCAMIEPINGAEAVTYEQRALLVLYLENSTTDFDLVLDKSSLAIIFGIELSLAMIFGAQLLWIFCV